MNKKYNYITPEIELVNIEIEQSILISSGNIENVGGRKEDQDW
jgi:hypothetical protein